MAPRPTVAEVAPYLAPAQVLLVARRGWLPWMIRRVTASAWNHVALIDRTASGIWITVEAADLSGVKALRLESYLQDETVTGLLVRDSSVLTEEDRGRVMAAAWLRVGQPYDTAQLVGVWARRRLAWLYGGKRRAMARNRLDARGKLICSELATIAYAEGAGLHLGPAGVAPGMVDPGHLGRTLRLVDRWRWDDW